MTGTKRYSELQQSLVGSSPKVLAVRLRFLEQEGLVTNTIYPLIPPHTDCHRVINSRVVSKREIVRLAKRGLA